VAEQVIVKRIDDITGEEGASLAEFALDGTSYEIDLTEGNRQKLKDSLAEFVAAARKVTGRRGRVATPRGKGAATVDAAQRKAARQWAQGHPDIVGFTVGDRGRLPDSVLALYDVHAGRNSAPVPVG
jgi:hypothetical protein